MNEWFRFRLVEDRNCPSYFDCLTTAALTDAHYVPCYECMGGVSMVYRFVCPKCQTLWVEEENKWLITKIVTCPFCNAHHPLSIVINEDKVTATILGVPHEPEIR